MRLLLINYECSPAGGGAGNATAIPHIACGLIELAHSPVVLNAVYDSQPSRSLVSGADIISVSARRALPNRSGLLEKATHVVAGAIALPRVLRTTSPNAAPRRPPCNGGPGSLAVTQVHHEQPR